MRFRTLLLATLLGLAFGASAQQPPPKINETNIALRWIEGRYLMPVTCLRKDGSRVEVEESIAVRPEKQRDLIKATFFGIDISDVSRCYNLVNADIPDRRGVLFLTYRSHKRADLGTADFRHELKDGELRYQIERGSLRQRRLGAPESEAQVVDFDGEDAELVVSLVKRGSDGDKLLGSPPPTSTGSGKPRVPRRLTFTIEGAKALPFTGYFLEDSKRWR